MTRCPAHGNRIQRNPSRAVNLFGATPQPDCRRTVIRENPLAADSLAIEPGHGPQQKAHRGCLLLVRQHFDVSQSCGIIDSHMSFLLTGTTATAEPSISGDPVTNPLKAGELFGVDVDHVAWPCPLVATYRLDRLQILEPAETQGLEHPANGRKRCPQHPGHSSERAALMAEVNSSLQLLWIERPPLAAANTASIHQCSRATGTPRRVISTSSPDSTASRRAESWAFAWATLSVRILEMVGQMTNLALGRPYRTGRPGPGCGRWWPGSLDLNVRPAADGRSNDHQYEPRLKSLCCPDFGHLQR